MFNSTRGGKNNSFTYNAQRSTPGKYKPPQTHTSPIMRPALKLKSHAIRGFKHQEMRAVRPDHAAFHSTRSSLGA